MNIVLLGAPGAGKGTQAALISKEYGIPHISTGDILRRNIKEGTKLGKDAEAFIKQGLLVPDEVVIDIVKDRLLEDDAAQGYLLDGFPRTLPQAEALEKVADIQFAINIIVPFDVIIKRLSGRRVCTCGETYHIDSLDGKEDCAKCGGKLVIRDDDKPETVKARLEVYEKQTAPLIGYYADKGVLFNIESTTKEDTFALIKKVLEK